MSCTNQQVADKKTQIMGKVLTFRKGVEDAYPEVGMRARCMDLRSTHNGEVVELVVDYTEFEDHNKKFESANYYDSNHNPILTAREAGFYKQREILYLDGTNGLDWDDLFIVDATEEEVTITLTQYELTQLRDWLNGKCGVDKTAIQELASRI